MTAVAGLFPARRRDRGRRSAVALLAGALLLQGCAALLPRGRQAGDPDVISPLPDGRRLATAPFDTAAALVPPDTTGAEPPVAKAAEEPRKPRRKKPPRTRVEARPTPTARGAEDTARTSRRSNGAVAHVPEVESVTSPEERRAMQGRIVADTSAAGDAVRRCASQALLPDQESVVETTRSLLVQARSALARDELWRAESLARKARQLALSLNCP
jgi:hypothetical protein